MDFPATDGWLWREESKIERFGQSGKTALSMFNISGKKCVFSL
jgi:hypothetical protein